MKKLRCANAHFFDGEKFEKCPICGADSDEQFNMVRKRGAGNTEIHESNIYHEGSFDMSMLSPVERGAFLKWLVETEAHVDETGELRFTVDIPASDPHISSFLASPYQKYRIYWRCPHCGGSTERAHGIRECRHCGAHIKKVRKLIQCPECGYEFEQTYYGDEDHFVICEKCGFDSTKKNKEYP